MEIRPKFELKEEVYLKTDSEQKSRLVIAYYVDHVCILYYLSCGIETSKHFDYEITREKQYL